MPLSVSTPEPVFVTEPAPVIIWSRIELADCANVRVVLLVARPIAPVRPASAFMNVSVLLPPVNVIEFARVPSPEKPP